jgi:hypothetical protein
MVCISIDANLAFYIFTSSPEGDFRPVFDWLHAPDKSGCVVYGGKLANELSTRTASRRYLLELSRAGRARLIPEGIIQPQEEELIRRGLCQSNDPHVIALARVSGARTLCSHDQKLHQDFRNSKLVSKPRGRVYQNATHTSLLRHDPCCTIGGTIRRRRRS